MPLNPYILAPGSSDRELRPPGFKELGDQALAQGKQAAAGLFEESLAKVKGNVVAPAFNAGLIEPYNLLAGGVNAAGELVGKDQLLAKQGPMAVDKVEFLSAGWLVQGVSGGLGVLLPYVLAGKAAGSGLRSLGSHLELEGKAAAVAQSGRLASVVGAFGYDLGRDKKEGETRLGNGMSGAAGFAVFESGNALAAGLGLPGRLLARTATGFVGGGVQAVTAEAVSRGRLVSKEDFGHAAISGMVMAHALPGAQRMLAGAADSINLGIGRGLPLDRLPERDGRFAEGKNSPAYKELVAQNPWARVQLDAPLSQTVGGKKVELREGAGVAELGHELVHLGQTRSAQFESQFVQAGGHLAGGNIESAWQTYRQARINQELAARDVESLVRRQLSGEQSFSLDRPGDIASQKVGSLTYEQHWAREFALFQRSGGAFRPVISFHGDEHRGGADKAHRHEPLESSSGQAKQELRRQIEALEETKPTDAELQRRESEYQRELATELVRSLQERKHIAVFAGGAVRDEIMGNIPKDFDIATSARPEQVERLFQSLGHRVIPVGKTFGVVNVVVDGREFEIATLRTDGEYTDGRRPKSVQFVSSLRADAARRDLTINAMFKDPISGQVYDFFGGQSDLSERILRAVGNPRERFAEDSLRMLRIPRFASRYGGFTIDLDTMAAIKANSIGIQRVSGERIRDELKGILTSSEPVRGMQIMMNAGLMKEVLPEVYRLRGPKGRQDPEHHPEKTVWTHTKLVLRNLTGGSFERMMGGLFHDVGKPDTQKFWPDGGISNHGHDARGAEITQDIARRLRLSGQQEQVVVDMVRLHMVMHEVQNLRPGKLAALLERGDVMDLIELQHADATGTFASKSDRSQKEFLLKKLDELRQQGKLGEKPIVDGRALLAMNLKPGPQFRTILEAARDAQREGEFTDAEGAQRWLKENVERLIEENNRSNHEAS